MIAEALTARAAEGVNLTLFRTPAGYMASVSFDERKSWRVEIAPDPVTAIEMALGLRPGAAGELHQPETGDVFE